MRRYLLIGLALVSTASGQRPNGGVNCEAGTQTPFQNGDLWGYLTPSGVTIRPQFKRASRFSSGVAVACTQEGCGLINTSGEFTTPLWESGKGNLARIYSEGLVSFTRGGKQGYADLSGQIVIPPRFDYAGDFDSGMARVGLNGTAFFINRNGERITREFVGAFDFSEGLAAVIEGQQVGYIARNGAFAIPPTYSGTSGIQFSEGLVACSNIGNKVGFMDKSGSIVVHPAYDDAYPFSEGLAPIRVDNLWGYVDRTGKLVIPVRYNVATTFTEGIASVFTNKWGYIDHAGNFKIAPTFDQASPFCAGLAGVVTDERIERVPGSNCDRTKGRVGFIDHSGSYVWHDSVERLTLSVCN